MIKLNVSIILLTHIEPIFPFGTPCKHEKTLNIRCILMFSGITKKNNIGGTLAVNQNISLKIVQTLKVQI